MASHGRASRRILRARGPALRTNQRGRGGSHPSRLPSSFPAAWGRSVGRNGTSRSCLTPFSCGPASGGPSESNAIIIANPRPLCSPFPTNGSTAPPRRRLCIRAGDSPLSFGWSADRVWVCRCRAVSPACPHPYLNGWALSVCRWGGGWRGRRRRRGRGIRRPIRGRRRGGCPGRRPSARLPGPPRGRRTNRS